MKIEVQSRRRNLEKLAAANPNATIIDCTSKADEPWVRFSPFYPHSDIPVPFSKGYTAESVEGVWQGLKVFESEDVDTSRFAVRNMKGIKRTVRTRGPVLGHRRGVKGRKLLDYLAARREIYLPTYRWVLEHRLRDELDQLREVVAAGPAILLDYETNADLENLQRPLSHASLVAAFLLGTWP